MPQSAQIAISVVPDPLRLLVVCPAGTPNCFGSLDATVTVTESAGVGGRVTRIELILQDAILGITLEHETYDSTWLTTHVGTDRIEPRGALAVRPVVEGYPFPASAPRPSLAVTLNVTMVDDKGHTVTATKRVPLETS